MIVPMVLLALVSSSPTPPPADGAPAAADGLRDGRVFVFAFRGDGVEERLVGAIERDVTEAATALGVDVISRQDVATMLDVEAARQAASCTAESACVAEIAGGLGARRFIAGTITALADEVEVALVLLDTSGAVVLGRASARGPGQDLPTLRRSVQDATGRLFGVEPAAPPGPHPGLLIGGGVTTAVGLVGLVGLVPLAGALTADGAARTAADDYRASGSRNDLVTLFDESRKRDDAVAAWNTWGAVAVAVGASVAVAGIVTMAVSPVVGGGS